MSLPSAPDVPWRLVESCLHCRPVHCRATGPAPSPHGQFLLDHSRVDGPGPLQEWHRTSAGTQLLPL
jgi:hypothetical protein